MLSNDSWLLRKGIIRYPTITVRLLVRDKRRRSELYKEIAQLLERVRSQQRSNSRFETAKFKQGLQYFIMLRYRRKKVL